MTNKKLKDDKIKEKKFNFINYFKKINNNKKNRDQI
jgi:hypothetical protein